jgi:hypothetical protein
MLWWRCSLLAGDWEEKIGPAEEGKRKARIKSDPRLEASK